MQQKLNLNAGEAKMFKIESTTNVVKNLMKKMGGLQADAFRDALNKTALDVRDELVDEMRKVFDRPTPYTLNSLRIERATIANLRSTIWFRGTDSMKHYIMPQVYGGNRFQKRSESLLRRRGILGAGEVMVPASNAAVRRDAYGNVSRGQIQQILSQLGAFYLAGSNKNETSDKKAKREGKLLSQRYFVARKGESRTGFGSWKNGQKIQHLKSGIWMRVRTISGNEIYPIFFFVSKATYRIRFKFHEVAQKTAKANFERQYNKALVKQLSKIIQ